MYIDQQSLIQKQLDSLSKDDDYSPTKSSSSPKRKYKPRLKKTPSPLKSSSNIKNQANLNERQPSFTQSIIGKPYVPSDATDSQRTDDVDDDDHDSDDEYYMKTHLSTLNKPLTNQVNKSTKPPILNDTSKVGIIKDNIERKCFETPIKAEESTEDEQDEQLELLKMKEIEMLRIHDERQRREAALERQRKIKDQIVKKAELEQLNKTKTIIISNTNKGDIKPSTQNKSLDSKEKENYQEIITPDKLEVKKAEKRPMLGQNTLNDLNKFMKRKSSETYEERVDLKIKKQITNFGSSENNNDFFGVKRKINDKEIIGMPDLKRTRSIDGAKLRSKNFIMPLQRPSLKESALKEIPIRNKLESRVVSKVVTLTKREPVSKPKVVTTSQSSTQGDSERWKNSWRQVLAENKTITVIRDISQKMSYNEEKLLSVVQAGFLSLGSTISPELSERTFILVIGSEANEVQCLKMKEIINQAQRRGCKVWNLQKSRRFFKHLDIEVEEMEKDYEMMRYIDYAKYKKKMTLRAPEPLVVEGKGSQVNKLNEYLTMESKIGNLDRDITAKREDYHYFADEKPHIYVYYKSQQFAPIISMEWRCPINEDDIFKDKLDLDALPYPAVKYSYNGRSPFARRDKEEIMYQRAFKLNRRGKEPIHILRYSDPNQKTVTKNLIKHRYEKDLLREDYALMIRRLYSESSIPNPNNNIYFFDTYYDKETDLWIPYNNTLSKMYFDIDAYEEKKNLSMTMKHHNESFNTSGNITLQSQLPEKPQQWKNGTQSPSKDGTTKYEEVENITQRPVLQRVNTQHMSEMKASGVLVGTNMGTGTGNGLQPVKNSVISAQMKVLQKRQLVLQKQMALQKQQQKKDDGKSKNGYCEGCRVKYDDYDKHIKSEKHVNYKNDDRNFSGIDELIRMISV
ncbi:uncharacterized protein HGUI_02879 [Hanseniaspora guilliermondii]|uniref:DBF4-type domain-containing protein n=1 Tax=Hanseniaspora guilliermondii TaxID=56406 RepID=A0A1L0D0M9_9ASCO|nr:uncharacterized protein HGUI_02879 [Hanseniaspora guilliermondii]